MAEGSSSAIRGRGRSSYGRPPRAAATPGAPVRGASPAAAERSRIRRRATANRSRASTACLPLSAAASVRRAGSRCPAGQPSGAEQPRQRAQCAADARLRQLPAHAAAGLCATASAAARPGGAACRSRSDPCRRWISPDATTALPLSMHRAPLPPATTSGRHPPRSHRTIPTATISAATSRLTRRSPPTATSCPPTRSRRTGPARAVWRPRGYKPRYGAIVRCELAGDRILAREQPIYGVE